MKKQAIALLALLFSSFVMADTTVTNWRPTACTLANDGSWMTISFPYTYNNKQDYSTVPHCKKDALQIITIPASFDINHALSMCLTAISANARLKIDYLSCENETLKPTANTTFSVKP
ncbi:MAG: hypothetical protein OXE99_02160 [Cellvibrionales bacterium]|nr:hypothetical protein [Cellvibrionales bacterium]